MITFLVGHGDAVPRGAGTARMWHGPCRPPGCNKPKG